MEKHHFELESFKNIQELIRFIDQKSGAVLLVSGLILTVFLEFSKGLIFSIKAISFFGIISFLFGSTTALLLTYVIYLSIFNILRPKLAKHYLDNEMSLIYFGHLVIMDKPIMHEHFKNADSEIILKNITDQIFEVSNILNSKTVELHSSMNYLFVSIISLLFFVLTSRLI